jgi:hypothetical protein
METTMELDELKSAWQALDRRFERQSALQLDLHRERRIDRARSSLRPLFLGQIAQILFGLVFILLAAMLWSTKPEAASVIAAGVVVHAYGIACLVLAGLVLGGIRRIDYAESVLDIQTHLARLRRLYVLSGMIAGLPWWFLWVPILMVLAGLGGANLYARAPSLVWTGLGVGAAGLLATAWFHRWARDARRPRLAKAIEGAVTGASLRRAQAELDRIRRYESE